VGLGLGRLRRISHDLLSTPILPNSSGLKVETSQAALARARNRMLQIATASVNIGYSFLYDNITRHGLESYAA